MNFQKNNQQGGFTGNFGSQPNTGQPAGGGQQAGGTQPAGQQAFVQPVQPTPPAYQAPSAPQPVQPAYPQPAPMAGMAPGGTQPAGAQGGAAGAKKSQFDPNYRFAAKMATFTTTITLPAHELTFDEARFLNLLAGSISLTKDEKKKIIDSVPKLRQQQVDELMRIFDEERTKFVELSEKHGPQLKKLEDEHMADWKDIELLYKSDAKTKEDDKKAADIRKQLGL